MAAEVLVPNSAHEAAEMYGSGDRTTVFGGGTILLPEIAAGRLTPDRALLLTRAGLDSIRVEHDRVVIGAMTPIAKLVDHPEELIAEVAGHIADEEVRRSATVGGNICAPGGTDAQRGDLGAPLLALGARVRSTGAGGERLESLDDFLAGDRSRRLVLEIEYDRSQRRHGTSGMRRRHAHSYAIAGVVASSAPDGSDLRVAVTGVGPTAVRCRTVEQSREPDDVLTDVDPIDDAVATAAYRRAVLPKLVREALDRLERA
jgi:carbon-monoxide dehydrogenase medium subunit